MKSQDKEKLPQSSEVKGEIKDDAGADAPRKSDRIQSAVLLLHPLRISFIHSSLLMIMISGCGASTQKL